ncbi:MAG: hypothetical protein V9E82_12695 [Candidatus Nanopelagicales bacterium]
MESRKFISRLTVVFGELHDPEQRATYSSLHPVPVEFSADGRFARLDVAGRTMTGRVLQAHTPHPLVYLGHPTLPVTLTIGDGWSLGDVPLIGTFEEPSLARVIAFAREGESIVCHTRIQWVDHLRLPMGRLELPVGDQLTDDTSVPARVLALPDTWPFTPPTLVVAVDDAQPLREAGWDEYLPDVLEALEWGELDGLTRCIETRSTSLLGNILLIEVTVLDLANLDVEALMFLPRDVRDGFEQALLALPD